MKIFFKDQISQNTYSIDLNNQRIRAKKATLMHITELLKKQSTFPSDREVRFKFHGKLITNDFLLNKSLNFHQGCSNEHDPFLLFYKSNVTKFEEIKQSSIEEIKKNDILMNAFKWQVENYPNAIAGTYQDKELNYLKLDQISNKLANFIMQNYSLENNVSIAVMGFNKLEMLICELAILKMGNCFVPFEPNIPKEHLNHNLNTSNTALIIACDEEGKNALLCQNISCPILDLLEKKEKIEKMDDSLENFKENDPSNLAYILYTSGTTASTAKGVMQTRAGLYGQIENYKENLSITNEDHFLQLAPFTHDQAIVDIFGALLNGAELHLVDMDLEKLDPRSLQRIISEKKITIFSSIPSVFSIIFEGIENDNALPSLRIITLGGETVKIKHVKLYQQIAPNNCFFINGYGATECSWISYYVIKKNDFLENMTSIPLGIMASKIEVFLDYTNGEEEKGIGELCVSSPFMSPGYFYNKETTDKAFFNKENKIYYRTGDLVSVDKEGIYHFEGRLNWHEKINGKRVNLKDIEDCILQNFPFDECIVISNGENPKRLFAFYTIKKDSKFEITELGIRHKLAELLKNHEIPFKFYFLEEFPRLPNAKVNRHELNKIITSEKQDQQVILNEEKLHIVDKLFIKILDLKIPPKEDFDFRLQGASSLDFYKFYNELNVYLSTFSNDRFQITLNELSQTKTISEIKKLIEFKIENINLINSTPIYEECKIYNYNYYPTIYVDNENISITFNFISLVVLANYYNDVYNICIIPCESQEKFLEIMDQFLKKGETGQIGLTWPQNNFKDGHSTPCIINIDEERNACMFISDSIGMFLSDKEKLLNPRFSIPIKIFVDPYERQIDEFSCGIDTLIYLKDGLRMKLIENIKIIDPKKVFVDKSRELYPEDVIFFQNPPELLKHSQSPDFPLDLYYPINPKERLKNSKKNETFEEFRRRNKKRSLYIIMEGKGSPLELEINTSLYKKGKKFRKIIDRYKRSAKS